MIETIRERRLSDGIEITNEVIKPVAEKWDDGLVHEIDNLQVTFRPAGEEELENVLAYLYYYDENGKELGHDFDVPESKIFPGTEARVSIMLIPPENFSYAVLELKADKFEGGGNYLTSFAIIGGAIAAIFLFKYLMANT